MAVASHILNMMESSSFIRKMFETGRKMKDEFGEKNVFDFSLGNPSADPPKEFSEKLVEIAGRPFPGKHKYMPNAGYPDVREKLGKYISGEYGISMPASNVIITCGAGGGLNVILKSILNPGDSVVVNAPCFMEYRFYAANHGGELRVAEPKDDFGFNFDSLDKMIDRTTAAMIINSPNNPSGKVYSENELRELAAFLEKKSAEIGRTVYLVSDEPYRKIVFDGTEVPSLFSLYNNAVVVTSYSKELSIPGERIGWVAVHPDAEDCGNIINAAILCNRILGYVNAPALMQKVIGETLGICVDNGIYAANREILCRELPTMGYDLIPPGGTFYLFPKAPGGDDMRFINLLREEKILAVPGSGFAAPGYFRIAFCVETETIERSLDSFQRAIKKI